MVLIGIEWRAEQHRVKGFFVEFYRLEYVAPGFPGPAIRIPIAALGGVNSAAALGFQHFTAGPSTRPIPQTSLVADLHSPRSVLLLAASDHGQMPGAKPGALFEITFPDDHPPGWEAAVHQRRGLLVLATEASFGTATEHQGTGRSWIALLRLTVWLYPNGVGTGPP